MGGAHIHDSTKQNKINPTHSQDAYLSDFQYSMLSLCLPLDHQAPTGTKDGGLSVLVSPQPLPDRISIGHV